VFYHPCRISLILLHTLAQCFISLSMSTSLGPHKAYHICIQLITAISSHPQKILLCPMPQLGLSLCVHFRPYIHHAFALDTEPAMSSGETRTAARTASANNYSVREEWLHQSGHCPSEPSETSRWLLTLHLVSIPRITLHIALPSQFHCFFSLCWSPILNEHSGFEGQL